MSTESEPTPADQPLLRVVNPDATPEEVAAIVAVLSALGGAEAPPPRKPRSLWAAPRPRTPLHHGPGAWRASGLPH
ncbi:acyl-CoA carboxylase subunit epsilon [Nocardioides sp. KR10-350]|uniref:acyl-CoA carboxylase subunit epsilon n=1 Tax=Nocardioides cheoyonin TaxID=3156615 RepID=UPI0032B536DC